MSKGSRSLRYASMDVLPLALRMRIEQQGTFPPAAQVGSPAAPIASEPKRKYHNHPTAVDGIRFDSKAEARYYEQLKLRRAAGEVAYFLRQVPIFLPGGSRYVVDFLVFFCDPLKPPDYVDVKGKETQVFRLKKREVEHHYPIRITLAR